MPGGGGGSSAGPAWYGGGGVAAAWQQYPVLFYQVLFIKILVEVSLEINTIQLVNLNNNQLN